ncbi:hypothetical protein R5R35_008528 [Gryllus longicercus]|uniref:Mitochondrial carnitine/acylcarnitine carrier protein n=1 Tax=Gryllus longicercus TaxID=2509291 RepID=A0AAN9VZ74_9ORTH
MPADRHEFIFLKYFLCGGFGGMCTVVVGHPFDTVKVRVQTMPKPRPGEKPLYTGTLDCAKKTLAAEGIRGLYKGMGAPFVIVVPIFSIRFFGFGIAKKIQNYQNAPLSLPQLYGTGALSGLFTTVAMTPGERVKCLLQIQRLEKGPPKYSGPTDVIKKLYEEGGIRRVYKGTGATLLRDIPSTGMYLMTYESLKRKFTPQEPDAGGPSAGHTILAGGLAGVAYWTVGIPADVLKSRVQAAGIGMYERGVRDALPELLRQDGVRGLYKGSLAVLLRAFPANAACFLGFEFFMKILNFIAPDP